MKKQKFCPREKEEKRFTVIISHRRVRETSRRISLNNKFISLFERRKHRKF